MNGVRDVGEASGDEITAMPDVELELRSKAARERKEHVVEPHDDIEVSKMVKGIIVKPAERSLRDKEIWRWFWDVTLHSVGELGPGIPVLGLIFSVTSMRIFVIPMWTFRWYLPIISPVYGQGWHWIHNSRSFLAILTHVSCGMVMLMCAAVQFDKDIRRRWPVVHRWVGRLYVLSGTCCVLSLYVLRENVGQGFGKRPNRAMQLGIDAGGAIWLTSTAAAVYFAAVAKNYVLHRRLMILSVCVGISPILQRLMIWIPLAPFGMFARLAVDACYGVPLWKSRWPTNHANEDSLLPPPLPREFEGPLTLTLNGYGVAEQMTFSFSSWGGLLTSLALASVLQLAPQMSNGDGISKHSQGVTEAYWASLSLFGDALRFMGLDTRHALFSSWLHAEVESFGTESETDALANEKSAVASGDMPVEGNKANKAFTWLLVLFSVPSLTVGYAVAGTVYVTVAVILVLYIVLALELLAAMFVAFVIWLPMSGHIDPDLMNYYLGAIVFLMACGCLILVTGFISHRRYL